MIRYQLLHVGLGPAQVLNRGQSQRGTLQGQGALVGGAGRDSSISIPKESIP